MVLVLSGRDVDDILQNMPRQQILNQVAASLHALSHSKSQKSMSNVQTPLRTSITTNGFTTLFMPACVERSIQGNSSAQTSIKVVSVPREGSDGLPATTMTFDPVTGKVNAIVNSSALTGVRTAAASALSLQLLPKRPRSVLAVWGSGTQAYHHIQYLVPLMDEDYRVYIIGRNRDRLSSLMQRLENSIPASRLTLIEAADTKAIPAIVRQGDVLCLCTPSTKPLFSTSDLNPVCHIVAIGSYKPNMIEFDLQSLLQGKTAYSPFVIVDSKEACLAEAGELAFLSHVNEEDRSQVVNQMYEIGQLVGGDGSIKNLARSDFGLSVYKSVGNGAMDVAITYAVVEEARRRGFTDNIDL